MLKRKTHLTEGTKFKARTKQSDILQAKTEDVKYKAGTKNDF